MIRMHAAIRRFTGLGIISVFLSSPLIAGESVEVGFERYAAAAPAESASFSGLLLNYYFAPSFYLGTSQSGLAFRNKTEYRPDFHIGLIFPLLGPVSAEATLGVDFFTALIIALAILDEDNNTIDYKFTTNFYTPYFTFAGALRFDFESFALKLISQIQLGGYLQNENSGFNASLWLGLGATYRFAL